MSQIIVYKNYAMFVNQLTDELAKLIQGDSLARCPKLLSIKNYVMFVNQSTEDELAKLIQVILSIEGPNYSL